MFNYELDKPESYGISGTLKYIDALFSYYLHIMLQFSYA